MHGGVLFFGLGAGRGDGPLHSFARSALVSFGAHDAAEEWNLHAGCGQTCHIVRSGYVLLVHETVWAIKEAIHKLERGGIVVHLLQKILHEVGVVVELIRADALDVFIIIALFFKDQSAKVLRQHKSCIIARGQQTAVD